MIYFIECDTAGNICHVCADPMATIVPLANRVLFGNKDGTPNKDADGNDLSPAGLPLIAPVGITAATYSTLMSDGLNNFSYNATSGAVAPKTTSSSTTTSTTSAKTS